MKRVFFFTHAGLVVQDALFARAVKDRLGLESVAIVQGRLDAVRAQGTNAFASVTDLIEDFDSEAPPEAQASVLERLAELDASAEEDSVRAAYQQDRWLTKRFGTEKSLRYAAHVLARLDSLASGGEPVAMVGELTMLHHRLARMRFQVEAPYAFPVSARFFERFYLEDTLFFEWTECQQWYGEFLKRAAPKEALDAAQQVVAGIRERGAAPAAFNLVKKHAAPSAEPLLTKVGLERLRLNLDYWRFEFPEHRRNPRVLYTPWEMLPVSKLARWGLESMRRRWIERRMVRELPRTTFATLFLHYQPEYTVDTLAFPFGNQVEWVRLVSQSLPLGMRLLVKEQPFMLGARPTEFYRQILRLPNVDILAPEVNGREAARQSKAVFTLSGTVALEAMILGVPAFIFCRVFHSNFEGIVRVTDPSDLPTLVRAHLQQFKPAPEKVSLAAIGAMYAGSRPGQLYSSAIAEELFSSKQNEEAVSSSFCEMLEAVMARHAAHATERRGRAGGPRARTADR